MSTKLTPPQEAVFTALHYGFYAGPSEFVQYATAEHNSFGQPEIITDEQCRCALQECLNRGWVQIVDESAIARIMDELQTKGILGPIYDMPHLGCVDFTPAGAEIWLAIQAEEHPDREPFAYTVVVREKTATWEEHHYCASEQGFEEIWRERREQGTIFLSSRIVPIGPWCVYWWRRFPSGYRLELELCGNRY